MSGYSADADDARVPGSCCGPGGERGISGQRAGAPRRCACRNGRGFRDRAGPSDRVQHRGQRFQPVVAAGRAHSRDHVRRGRSAAAGAAGECPRGPHQCNGLAARSATGPCRSPAPGRTRNDDRARTTRRPRADSCRTSAGNRGDRQQARASAEGNARAGLDARWRGTGARWGRRDREDYPARRHRFLHLYRQRTQQAVHPGHRGLQLYRPHAGDGRAVSRRYPAELQRARSRSQAFRPRTGGGAGGAAGHPVRRGLARRDHPAGAQQPRTRPILRERNAGRGADRAWRRQRRSRPDRQPPARERQGGASRDTRWGDGRGLYRQAVPRPDRRQPDLDPLGAGHPARAAGTGLDDRPHRPGPDHPRAG